VESSGMYILARYLPKVLSPHVVAPNPVREPFRWTTPIERRSGSDVAGRDLLRPAGKARFGSMLG